MYNIHFFNYVCKLEQMIGRHSQLDEISNFLKFNDFKKWMNNHKLCHLHQYYFKNNAYIIHLCL